MARREDVVRELYGMARELLDSGRVFAAAVLAVAALELLGVEEYGDLADALRRSVAAGVEPSPEAVREALGFIVERLGGQGQSGPGGGLGLELVVGLGAACLVAASLVQGILQPVLAGPGAAAVLAAVDVAVHRKRA